LSRQLDIFPFMFIHVLLNDGKTAFVSYTNLRVTIEISSVALDFVQRSWNFKIKTLHVNTCIFVLLWITERRTGSLGYCGFSSKHVYKGGFATLL